MHYFTRAFCNGELSDEMFERQFLDYKQYIDRHIPSMSEPVRRLATEISLHDSKIMRALIDHSTREVQLLLRCGDLQQGYFDLALHYRDVSNFLAEPQVSVIVDN